jgi:transposase
VDAKGKIVRETKVASDPDALVAFFKSLGFPVARIGLEAGPLSQWLYAGLARTGFFKPVHVKSLPSHAVRALLIARKKLVGQRDTLEPMSFSRKLFYTAVTIRKT